MSDVDKTRVIKNNISSLIKEYVDITSSEEKFIPGVSTVQYSGPVYDHNELQSMMDTMLQGWFGLGVQGEKLEKEIADYVGVKKAFLTNSGSSADLLAFSTLMSYQFPEGLKKGDEVITPACTFPTAVSALVLTGLVPVFVDIDLETLNSNTKAIEKAITKKTKAIFLVHMLGNPNDMDAILKIAREHKLFVIEDNCDALGSMYGNKKTGSFGILATESFYPAHHITTAGEGGAILLNDLRLQRVVSSIRDWGRACWCGASGGGPNGACNARFKFNIDGIPYDHKYIFSHIGYNLKPVEIQAAMGREQLKKLPLFIKRRKENFSIYNDFFKQYEKYFILPQKHVKSDPSWFAYPITIRKNLPFDRFTIIKFLEDHHIQTRPLFAGNILKQPGFKNINYRISGSLQNSNISFTSTFFIGVYPGIKKIHRDYVMTILQTFLKKYA
jgi:CDP-4-dehydro-6-deoxyglucose reductase, E1